MKRLRTIVASCAIMLATAAAQGMAYEYDSVPGDMMKARIYTLGNGLRVYITVNDEKPRVQTYIAVRAGSRNDPAETTGLAHYLEHLMFKGTDSFGTSDFTAEAPLLDSIQARYELYRRTADMGKRAEMYHDIDSISQLAARYNIPNEYDKLMAGIGAEGSNAYTAEDVTCYTEDIPSNEIENWAKIQGERFMNMVIRGFHTELEAVYEEYNIGIANDDMKAWTALAAKLFPGHPYGTQTTIGTQEHLKNPSIVNIMDYFHRYYVPNNVAICLSGDMDPDKTIEIIDKYFGSWKPDYSLLAPPSAPLRKLVEPADTTVWGNEAEFIVLGWQLDGASSLQADTVEVVSYMLDNGTAGLFDLDINQRMLCASATAFHQFLNEYSCLVLWGKPKDGQTLDEVRALMKGEMDKLRSGDFDDGLLTAVINNLKLDYRRVLEDNSSRAGMFVDAFVNRVPWEQAVGKLERMSRLTKQDIVDFANRHFADNYAAVYKRVGEDTTLNKIDKPKITAIPANRDMQSSFVSDILNSEPEPIEPRFIDFNTDMVTGTTAKGLPVRYVKDTSNGTFTLAFCYNTGEEYDKWMPYAAEYIGFLGTDEMTAEQRKQLFYRLACDMDISVGGDYTFVTLSGLAENMPQALELAERFLANARADTASYSAYVDITEANRRDAKLSQSVNYYALCKYGMYGEYNPVRNVPDSVGLRSIDPQELVGKIQALGGYEHEVLYCGPAELEDVSGPIDIYHLTADNLVPAPKGTPYTEQLTETDEIILAPYPAKNIYMRQYNNEGKQWNPADEPLAQLFNEYFGGGMNSIVFQELRESRALAYNAYAAYISPSRKGHPEYSMTHIISQNDKMMDCITTFNAILDTIPQSDKAFDLAKQALKKRLATARTTRFGILNAYIAARRMGIDYDINKLVYEALPSLTLDDMVRFERVRMAGKPRRYMILGDESELDIDALEKIAPVRRVTTDFVFGF